MEGTRMLPLPRTTEMSVLNSQMPGVAQNTQKA